MTLSVYVGITTIALGIMMLWSSTNQTAVSVWSTAVLSWDGEQSLVNVVENRLVVYGIGLLLFGLVLVFAV
jgi:hypothetical protein